MKQWTKEEIEKELDEYRSHIDYEVGDWVETCNLLPGIVQKITLEFDETVESCYIDEDVEVFYPHMAFDPKYKGQYQGGSCCSIIHCGVHKILPDYAIKLMALGEDELKKLWNKMSSDCEKDPNLVPCWEDYVERRFEEVFRNDGSR